MFYPSVTPPSCQTFNLDTWQCIDQVTTSPSVRDAGVCMYGMQLHGYRNSTLLKEVNVVNEVF